MPSKFTLTRLALPAFALSLSSCITQYTAMFSPTIGASADTAQKAAIYAHGHAGFTKALGGAMGWSRIGNKGMFVTGQGLAWHQKVTGPAIRLLDFYDPPDQNSSGSGFSGGAGIGYQKQYGVSALQISGGLMAEYSKLNVYQHFGDVHTYDYSYVRANRTHAWLRPYLQGGFGVCDPDLPEIGFQFLYRVSVITPVVTKFTYTKENTDFPAKPHDDGSTSGYIYEQLGSQYRFWNDSPAAIGIHQIGISMPGRFGRFGYQAGVEMNLRWFNTPLPNRVFYCHIRLGYTFKQ